MPVVKETNKPDPPPPVGVADAPQPVPDQNTRALDQTREALAAMQAAFTALTWNAEEQRVITEAVAETKQKVAKGGYNETNTWKVSSDFGMELRTALMKSSRDGKNLFQEPGLILHALFVIFCENWTNASGAPPDATEPAAGSTAVGPAGPGGPCDDPYHRARCEGLAQSLTVCKFPQITPLPSMEVLVPMDQIVDRFEKATPIDIDASVQSWMKTVEQYPASTRKRVRELSPSSPQTS